MGELNEMQCNEYQVSQSQGQKKNGKYKSNITAFFCLAFVDQKKKYVCFQNASEMLMELLPNTAHVS